MCPTFHRERDNALRRVASKLDTRSRATVYKAQVRSVMEYASLSWMSASQTTLELLDSIQRKALRIIGTSEEEARSQLNISSLHHRRQVAAATVLYKMHISLCSRNLKALLPEPFVVRRATRSSLSLPSYACWQCPFPEQYLLTEPLSTLQFQSGTACLMTWLATFLTTVNRPSSVECMSI